MLDIDKLIREFDKELTTAGDLHCLNELRQKFLRKKSDLKLAFRDLRLLQGQEKIEYAKSLNKVVCYLEVQLSEKSTILSDRENAELFLKEKADVALPGMHINRGALHPIRLVEQRCLNVLRQLGFSAEEGPEVEDPFYNFDALNIPEHHPARDMQDTFWVQGGRVLRSHTTSVQARILAQKRELPIKVASAGRVYRNEAVDASHLAMFHQLEGFWLEKGLNFSHLKGVLLFIAKQLYGQEKQFRFKPKFYPYTEPSIGLDIQCANCLGKGCPACHSAGWITIMGAGMIHNNILKQFGYYGQKVRGIAFGWGTTRVTSQWLGLSRLKDLYSQDQRFFKAISGRSF